MKRSVRALLVLGLFSPLPGCTSRSIQVVELERSDPFMTPPSEPAPGPAPVRGRRAEILAQEELTLEDVLAVAEEVNPDLNQARQDVDLGNALVWDASLYPNPSLVAALDDYHPHGGTWATSKRTIGVGIPIVTGGRIQANVRLAESQRDQLALGYVWRRREILTQVKQAFLNVMAHQQNLELTKKTVELIKNFHSLAEERFKLRAIPEMELLKATVELAKAETDQRTVEKNLAVSIQTLKSLMGNIDLPREKFRGTLPPRYTIPAMEDLRKKVLDHHPLLEAARKQKELHEREVELLKASAFPDVQAQVLAGVDSGKETVIQGGLSVPIPIFDRNQAKIAVARIEIRRAEFLIDSQWNDLLLRLNQSHHDLEEAQARVVSYEEKILPSAQKAMEQTGEGYRQGKFSYLDVLDAERTLVEARAAYSDALLDLNTAASELEKLLGAKLVPGP
jgi:cobalt-zinc-cadmium efflux system outer membrane protein